MQRDRFRCVLCTERFKKTELSVHHILARRFGGQDHAENLVTMCNPCHDMVEAQDFECAEHFWNFVFIWHGGDELGAAPRPDAYDTSAWRLWVYGGYKNPNR